MKKFLSITAVITILSTSLFLTGCRRSSSDLDTSYEALSTTGMLQSLGGIRFSGPATHLLRELDGDILYVYSEFYDLDDEGVLNHSLSVSGFVIPPEEEGGKSTLAIETLEVLTPEEVAQGLVTKEVYRSEALQFSIMYRTDWLPDEGTSLVTWTAPVVLSIPADDSTPEASPSSSDTFSVRRMSNVEGLEIEEWFKAYILPDANLPYSLSEVGPEHLPAIRVVQTDTLTFYVHAGSAVYVISHRSMQPSLAIEYSNLFAEVLYSFDPLQDGTRVPPAPVEAEPEPTETEASSTDKAFIIPSGYAPLQSATAHFSMAYPSAWYYSREGAFFYFSDGPAEAANALITLELRSSSTSPYDESTSVGIFTVNAPRDDRSSYRLSGASDYADVIRVMANSLRPFES